MFILKHKKTLFLLKLCWSFQIFDIWKKLYALDVSVHEPIKRKRKPYTKNLKHPRWNKWPTTRRRHKGDNQQTYADNAARRGTSIQSKEHVV